MSEPLFLSKQSILEVHAEQIEEHGGDSALLDEGLLDSAISQAMSTFEGAYLHEDLFLMAAAYIFHITMNHPFADGNKRTGLTAALVFLESNGWDVADDETELADMVLEMVVERRDKRWVADILRRRAMPR